MKQRFFILPFILLCSTAHSSLGITNFLTQGHFLIDPSSTNVCDFVVFRDLDSNVVSSTSVSTQIMARIQEYCQMTMPNIEFRGSEAKDFINMIVDSGTPAADGSVGLGTLIIAPTNSTPDWLEVLPVDEQYISSSNLTNVAYLELIDRIAQILNLKTGVLDTGALIYGTDGNWVTNYFPSYTLELSVRYSE